MASSKDILLGVAYECKGDWNEEMAMIKAHKEVKKNTLALVGFGDYEKSHVTIIDSCYPSKFKSMPKPVLVFEFEGDVGYLKNKQAGFVYVDGENDLGIDGERIIRVATEGWVYVGNQVRLRENATDHARAVEIACALADRVLLSTETGNTATIANCACGSNTEVYAIPTEKPSMLNDLIKSGAFLADKASDLDNE